MESTTGYESVAKKRGTRLDKKCSIHVHSRTNKLADADGRSSKAVIDGLCLAGILPDDSPKFVSEVSHSQEAVKGKEETIIDITWD